MNFDPPTESLERINNRWLREARIGSCLDCEKKQGIDWITFIKYLMILILIILVLVWSVSLSSASDFTEKFGFCDSMNFTVGECVTFWASAEALFTCTNETIYVNQTLNQTVEVQKR